MAEKTIPWWRKALNFALGGLRSGFGLFSRSAEPEAIPEANSSTSQPETQEVVTQQKNQEEESALIEPSPQPEIVAVPEAIPAQPVAEPTPAPEPEAISEPVPEPIEIAEAIVEPEAITESASPPREEAEALQAEEKVEIESALCQGTTLVVPQMLQDESRALAPENRFSPETTEPVAESEAVTEPLPQTCEEAEALQAEEKVEIESALYQGTTLVVPQMLQNESRALAPEERLSPEAAEFIELAEAANEAAPEAVIEPEPEPVAEPIAESEAVIEPLPEHVEEPEAIAQPEPEPQPQPAPAEGESAIEPTVPEPEPSLILTPQPTAEEAANKIADEKLAARLAARQKKLDESSEQSPFSVIVGQVYDGPLDLLLDLIRKQDIDIYDIPIAKITSQFLAYVNQLKASDVDVAGEFIYTASLLIHIKSKMLLPRADAGPEDAAEDPRRELVERLLEHERFKNAAQMLQQKQMLEAATWTNPGAREFKDDEGTEPEIAADTVDLVRIFREILERARTRPVIDVEEDSVTVGQMIQFLSRRLAMEDKPVALRRLLSHTRSERALIAMFLALLELVRLQAILLRQDRAFSEIFIKKNTGFDAVMSEGLMTARDDWR